MWLGERWTRPSSGVDSDSKLFDESWVTFSSEEEPKSKAPPVTQRDRWATRKFKTDQRLCHPPEGVISSCERSSTAKHTKGRATRPALC
jgi:hypothetical protein